MTSDQMHFCVAYEHAPASCALIWREIVDYLEQQKCLPAVFNVMPSILGDGEYFGDTERLKLGPAEIANLLETRRPNKFWADTGHSARSVAFQLLHSKLTCRIESDASAPGNWSTLIQRLCRDDIVIGGWQWRHLYRTWQCSTEARVGDYERRFGPIPPGYIRYIVKSDDGIGPDREFLDISLNPGRTKEIKPGIFFYPTAEMWLGPGFWQFAKCSKEEVMAQDFFIEKRETPHFLYLKSWPEPFNRPDGEQGRMQQRLWRLLFHEDCEWPPGSGGISDVPMYGPKELMPGFSTS